MLVSMSTCPNCGAPISGKQPARHAICLYCNVSLTLTSPAAGSAPATFAAQAVAGEDVERVKQLVFDGKRDDAIALYAQLALVSREEAERAVENLLFSSYLELTQHLPIGALGVVFHLVWIALATGLAAWGAAHVSQSLGYAVPAVLGGLLALYRTYMLLRHLRATYTHQFGALGRGRVLRRAVVRYRKERDDYWILVLFEVTPDDGSASFMDQETLFVGSPSFAKLAPGNVVRVRYDGAREHVYPSAPVTVIS
jgi:hypothetical protein